MLIERFTGERWFVADVSTVGLLDDVDARRWDDVWAVGRTVRDNRAVTLTLHFDGQRWERVRSPNLNEHPHYLYAVASAGEDEVWAAGEYSSGERPGPHPILMHYNGSRWRYVDLDLPDRASGSIWGLSTHGDEVVAVGDYHHRRTGYQALILTYDGETWTRIDTSGLRDSDQLLDVEHAPDGSVFAAGVRRSTGVSEAIFYRPPMCGI